MKNTSKVEYKYEVTTLITTKNGIKSRVISFKSDNPLFDEAFDKLKKLQEEDKILHTTISNTIINHFIDTVNKHT